MAELLWTKEFKARDIDGLYVVPEFNAVYSLNGSNTYSGMRIRKLDIKTGTDLCSFVTRSYVNSLAFSYNLTEIVANTDKKIFVLSSENLTERRRCETRVPKYVSSMVNFGPIVAMKSRTGDFISMYDLDTMKAKRITVGEGIPLFRDIEEDFFIACSGPDGTVWRIHAQSEQKMKLLEGVPYDAAAIDYASQRLWLSQATPRDGYGNAGPSTNRLHTLSLKDSSVEDFTLEFTFSQMSVSKNGEHLWVGRDYRCDNCTKNHLSAICVLSVKEQFKVIEEFEPPDDDLFTHMDARAGVVFTEERHFERLELGKHKEWVILKCWRL